MGAPVKIVDLARQMIRLAGLTPDRDVEIRFTGLLMASPRTADPAIVGRAINEIAAACRGGQARLALTLLGRLVTEFEHNSEGLMPVVNRP